MQRHRNPASGLGRTQRLVLQLLALNQPCSASELARHWYGGGLTESAAGSAVSRLADRGLIDLGPGEWTGGRFSRTYVLTERGVAVERQVSDLDPIDADGDT
jgi:DNA-binding MarR family transcriptional regulator